MSDEFVDTEDNDIPTLQTSSEISPVRSTVIPSPPNEPLNGYLNSTQASTTSPLQRQKHIVPLDVSRIPNRTYDKTNLHQCKRPSRFAYNNIKNKALPVIFASVNNIPRSMYNISPKYNNRNLILASSNFNAPKQPYNKKPQLTASQDHGDSQTNLNQQNIDQSSAHPDISIKYAHETHSQKHVSNILVKDETDVKEPCPTKRPDDDNRTDGAKTSINAFALLKRTKGAETKKDHGKKENRKTKTSVCKPAKAPKQTLVYDSDRKNIKVPRGVKGETKRYVYKLCQYSFPWNYLFLEFY